MELNETFGGITDQTARKKKSNPPKIQETENEGEGDGDITQFV